MSVTLATLALVALEWCLFFFCLLAFDLGLFSEQLLAPRQDATYGFQQVRVKVKFSDKSLRPRLALLERQGMQQG
jgi:hypothetical protein